MPSTVKLRGCIHSYLPTNAMSHPTSKDKLRDTSLSVYTNSDLRFEPDVFGMRRRENRNVLFNDAINFQDVFPWILNSWFRASWFNVNKKVQLDATVCRHLFTAQSLYMFRASQHPSSGVLKTISATSAIGHVTGTAASFQRGLIRPRWKEVAVPVSWPIPEVVDTVFSTPDDGCCDTRNM